MCDTPLDIRPSGLYRSYAAFVDPSALIFVALAVAWAVYLVPKALKHHDEAVSSRSVEKFSQTMRVLARREPVDRRNARLILTPPRAPRSSKVETKPRSIPGRTTSVEARRQAARRAASRRRNVLAGVAAMNLLVLTLCATAVIAWPWMAPPVTVLAAWLVACRISVKAERSTRTGDKAEIEIGLPAEDGVVEDDISEDDMGAVTEADLPVVTAQPGPVTPATVAETSLVLSGEIPIVKASIEGGWDMVPTTLPTYVTKPAAARRSVQTIDLESTGVWSSGRKESDSALAREAEAAKAEAEAEAEGRGADQQRNIG